MSYIGNTSTTQAFTPAVDFFNGNGSTTAFTLSRPVASVAQVQAVISNVPQKPGDAFTVSGNTITFTSAPPSGTSNIYVYYTSPITQVIAPGQNTVTTTALQDGSVTPAKLSTGAPTWNTSGNTALNGATPSAWTTYTTAWQNTSLSIASNGVDATAIGTNWYYDGQNRYRNNGYAAIYFQYAGQHLWYSSDSGSAGNTLSNLTQLLGVEKGKTLALQGATSATGTGITFPATQSASSNANTLDDYEEGTWTPTVNYNGGSFSASTAYYTKVGRLVNVSITVNYNASAGVGVNLNSISGLPFQNASSQSIPAPCGLFYIMTTSTGDNNTAFPGFIMGGNASEITLYTSQAGSTEGRPRFNSVNAYMQINCTYVST